MGTGNYTAEIYLSTNEATKEHWQKFYLSILQYTGAFIKFELIVTCQENLVRYFVRSDKDLSVISNSIDNLILRPIARHEQPIIPNALKTERLIQFVSDGNILDLKEKLLIKRNVDLQYCVFTIRPINIEKAGVKVSLYLKKADNSYGKATKRMLFFPARLLEINFESNTRYLNKTPPKYLNIEKSLHLLTPDKNQAIFEVDTFPYFSRPYYLNIGSYDFDKHSFIIGATGSGKSKLISLYVDRLYKTFLKDSCRIIIIDPHASLHNDVGHIADSKVVNFNSESTQLFSDDTSDITAATELTATLFSSLLHDQFNARLDRTLRFSLFVLFTAQNMSLDNLKRFLTDTELRSQILEHVVGYIPQNIVQYFGTDFNEIRTKYYNEALMPIISLVDEMQLQPALINGGDVSLTKTIQENFLTVFSLNKVSMGEKTVRTVAGLLIQQIFLLAQARVFGQKIILIIDEVSVIQNPALSSILAEARKFNLTIILTQQYFGQIEKSLQDAIFANVYNYYVFKVSEEDARALEGNLNIELPKTISSNEVSNSKEDVTAKVKIMTELNPRECLVRLSAKGTINPALKVKTVEAPKPISNHHEEMILRQLEKVNLPDKFEEHKVKHRPSIDDHDSGAVPGKSETGHTESEVGMTLSPGPEVFKKKGRNLKDLLSQHSSSRIDLRNRKEK